MPDPNQFHRGGYGGSEGASSGTLYNFDMPDAGAYNEAATLQTGYGNEQYNRLMSGKGSYASDMLHQGQIQGAQGLQSQAMARGASPSAERAAVMGAGNMAAQNVGVAEGLDAQAMQQAQMMRMQTMNQMREGEMAYAGMRAAQDQMAANHYAQMAGVQAGVRAQDLGMIGSAIGAGGAGIAGGMQGAQNTQGGNMPSGEDCKREKRAMAGQEQQRLVDALNEGENPLQARAVAPDRYSPEADAVRLAAQHMQEGFGSSRPVAVPKLAPIRPMAPENASESHKQFLKDQALRDYETYQPRGAVRDDPMSERDMTRFRRGIFEDRVVPRFNERLEREYVDDAAARSLAAEKQRAAVMAELERAGVVTSDELYRDPRDGYVDAPLEGYTDPEQYGRSYREQTYGFNPPGSGSVPSEPAYVPPIAETPPDDGMDNPYTAQIMRELAPEGFETPWGNMLREQRVAPGDPEAIIQQLRAGDMQLGGGVQVEMGSSLPPGSFQGTGRPMDVMPSGEDLKTVIGTLPLEQQVMIFDRERKLGEAKDRAATLDKQQAELDRLDSARAYQAVADDERDRFAAVGKKFLKAISGTGAALTGGIPTVAAGAALAFDDTPSPTLSPETRSDLLARFRDPKYGLGEKKQTTGYHHAIGRPEPRGHGWYEMSPATEHGSLYDMEMTSPVPLDLDWGSGEFMEPEVTLRPSYMPGTTKTYMGHGITPRTNTGVFHGDGIGVDEPHQQPRMGTTVRPSTREWNELRQRGEPMPPRGPSAPTRGYGETVNPTEAEVLAYLTAGIPFGTRATLAHEGGDRGVIGSGSSLKCRIRRGETDENYDDLMRRLEVKSFKYKPEVVRKGAPAGPRVGMMADPLIDPNKRDNPLGERAVADMPELGKGAIGLDRDELLSLAMGLHGRVNDRLEALEKKA